MALTFKCILVFWTPDAMEELQNQQTGFNSPLLTKPILDPPPMALDCLTFDFLADISVAGCCWHSLDEINTVNMEMLTPDYSSVLAHL